MALYLHTYYMTSFPRKSVQQMIPVRDTLYGLHQKYFLKLRYPSVDSSSGLVLMKNLYSLRTKEVTMEKQSLHVTHFCWFCMSKKRTGLAG